jgi:glycerol uptake facilitator-like aquaporin
MLARRAFAEFLGTALLLIAVVGSGIAAQRLSPGNTGLQLFENAAATAVALVAIILALGAVSGAHLNPVITLADRAFGAMTNREASAYIGAQLVGAVAGTMIANVMFDLPVIEISDHARSGGGILLGEVVATFGLLLVVFGVAASGRITMAAFAVGAYIGGAYFFTSSTSFANPAVTIARSLTDTFTGIEPAAVPGFVLMQFVGAALGVVAVLVLYPSVRTKSNAVIVPHLDPEVSQ